MTMMTTTTQDIVHDRIQNDAGIQDISPCLDGMPPHFQFRSRHISEMRPGGSLLRPSQYDDALLPFEPTVVSHSYNEPHGRVTVNGDDCPHE